MGASPVNWLKANTDATFKERTVALTFVLKDSFVNVIYLEPKLYTASTPFEVELRALAWALYITKDKSWKNVVWSSDVVKEINSSLDPFQWDTRYFFIFSWRILQLKG